MGEMFLSCVADLGGTSGPDLELDNYDNKLQKNAINECYIEDSMIQNE